MKTTFVCIAALLIMVATVPAQAQTAITPFGNIAWEDSIGTVTQKMRALPGIGENTAPLIIANAQDVLAAPVAARALACVRRAPALAANLPACPAAPRAATRCSDPSACAGSLSLPPAGAPTPAGTGSADAATLLGTHPGHGE